MPEIILCGNVGIRIASKCQDVLDAFAFEDVGELVDLGAVVMEACEVDHRLDLILVLDLLGELDRAVAVGRSACAESNAYEVRLKLAQRPSSVSSILSSSASFFGGKISKERLLFFL